jgi:predicted acetyltransferase
VASAAVLQVDGIRYVALVATEPSHQRQGYAEAVMRHALEVSARVHGERPTVLHATDAGRPIYARMGYQPIATHTAFIETRFLTGH